MEIGEKLKPKKKEKKKKKKKKIVLNRRMGIEAPYICSGSHILMTPSFPDDAKNE
jgi:hypothetical protein